MKYYLLPKLISARTQLSLAMLLVILQRSPAIRLLLNLKESIARAPSVQIVQSFLLPATALAAPHAISGATGSTATYNIEFIDTPEVKVGLDAYITFTVSVAPKSWTYSGSIPPGMRLTDLRNRLEIDGDLLATDQGVLRGTPTQAGSYQLTLTPWENEDGTGNTADDPLILTISVAEGETPTISIPPELNVSKTGNALSLSWQIHAGPSYQLESSSTSQEWTPVTQTPQTIGGTSSIQLPLTAGKNIFYRLAPTQ